MQTSIKPKRNRKWKIPHTVLERRTLSFSSHKNCKLKVKLWWVGAHERKKRAFCIVFFFVWRELFYDCCFISMYSVLIALSEYTYFYILKKITSYTFAVCFKIVGSFQCILNFNVWTNVAEVLNESYVKNLIHCYWYDYLAVVSEKCFQYSLIEKLWFFMSLVTRIIFKRTIMIM